VKIYLAAPYAARERVAIYAQILSEMGHQCTSEWAMGRETHDITEGTIGASPTVAVETVKAYAGGDFSDIDRADALIVLTGAYITSVLPDIPAEWLHTGGRHVEVGEPENVFQRGLCLSAYDIHSALEALMNAPKPIVPRGMNPIAVPDSAKINRPWCQLVSMGPPPGVSDDDCGTAEMLIAPIESALPGVGRGQHAYFRPSADQARVLLAGGYLEFTQWGMVVQPFSAEVCS